MARGDKYEPLIQKYAKKYGVPAGLMREQIRSESNFNPRAVSSAGAAGIAQFMPKTGNQYGMKAIKKGNKWYATEDFFDPEKSIEAQARYMSDIYNKQAGKDWGVTLAMYNMGPKNVKERGLESIFLPGGEHYKLETQGYVNRTLKRAGVRSPRIEGVLAKSSNNKVDNVLYDTPVLQALANERNKLVNELNQEAEKYLSTYEQDSESAYNAQPDLDLMRELAQRAYQQDQENQMTASNLASQLASIMNPAFAKQFKDQTSPRVNAARQYFANLGMLNRQAMSASQAKARAKRRSDQKQQSLRGRINAMDQQIGALRLQGQRAEDAVALESAKNKGRKERDAAKPAAPEKSYDIAAQINTRMKALKETLEKVEGDADQQILKQMGGMEMFLPALLDENNKDPELVRLREKYKAQIEEDRLQLDAFRLLKTKQSRYTESELKEAIERIRAARDPNNLAPETLPIDSPQGAAKRFKNRRDKGAR
tara:strand:+ start:9908 stop:11353 length:1446 start_codon:yes stop_codon:yes gene_type:complete